MLSICVGFSKHDMPLCVCVVLVPVLQAVSQHGLRMLGLGQHARTASLFTNFIVDVTRAHGPDSPLVINSAASLGKAFLGARKFETAVGVFAKAWESRWSGHESRLSGPR